MIDIFIKSYAKDFKLLKYALLSITKNVSGYRNIVLLIPKKEKDLFDTRELPERTLIHYVEEYGNKYLLQQWLKISAYKYSDAEYILFSDSDVIFDRPIDLNDYIGKPEILYTDWSKVGDAICWRQPTETVMGEAVEWEFMRRNCLVYHRSTLVNIGLWQPNLEYIIMNSERFSEFNLIGAYAYKNEREKYNFINTDSWQYTEPKGVQLWSHFDRHSNEETHIYETKRFNDVIKKVFG